MGAGGGGGRREGGREGGGAYFKELRPAQAWVLHAQIKGVLEKLFVVCSAVQDDGKDTVGGDAACGGKGRRRMMPNKIKIHMYVLFLFLFYFIL